MPRPKNKAWNEFPPPFYSMLERFARDTTNLELPYTTRSKAETARADLYHFFRVLQNSVQYDGAKPWAFTSRRLTLSVQGTSPAKLVISWNEPVADRLEQALKENGSNA